MASAIFSPLGLSSIAYFKIASLTKSRYPVFSGHTSRLSTIAAWGAAMKSVFRFLFNRYWHFRNAAPDPDGFMPTAHTANFPPEYIAEKFAKMNDALIYLNTQHRLPVVLEALNLVLFTCGVVIVGIAIGRSLSR